MGQRAGDNTQAAMVDDVLGGLGAEGLVEGYGPEGLGKQRELCSFVLALRDAGCEGDISLLTCDLPFWPVLRPQPNTVLVLRDAQLALDLDDTGAEVLSPLGNLGVGHPDILGLPRLGDGVPWPPSQASVVGYIGG